VVAADRSGVALALLARRPPACGGLVGETARFQLTRTTTLAAITTYRALRHVVRVRGQGKEVGSIVPLPAVRRKVERRATGRCSGSNAKSRARQREAFDSVKSAAASTGAEVILQTKIDALDITVLRGGGNAVGKWATSPRVPPDADAPAMLDFYARRSPIFMGRASTRACEAAGSEHRRRHADHGDDERPTGRGFRCAS